MDMELQHTKLGGFRPVYDNLIRQEETLESIVPDALPDIGRIVETSGTVFLRQRETVDGSVRVTGTARTVVLYLPEEGETPCCLTLNIPFLCSGDHPAIQSGCLAHVSARVISADAQELNPRKILARVELAVGMTAYLEEQAELCCGVECGEGDGVQTLIETHKDFIAVDVTEKNFNFSDVLRLPPSRSAMEQLLSARTELSCAEAKVIGKKLVVKGEAVLTALYIGQGGVCSARFELPFSQIIEIKTAGDECDIWAEAALTGMECTMRTENELEVNFDVLLQAVVRQERDVSTLADLYSVSHPLETERKNVALCPLVEQGGRRQIARQFCPCDAPARQVIQCTLTIGEITQVPSGENAMVTAKAYADVLYLSEAGELCAASYTVPASCEIPMPENSRCLCRCRPAGEAAATPVTGGLEIRFEAEFIYLITRNEEYSCISAVRPGEESECACERPSVVIRMVGEGERLWDIAKCCGSTVANIQTANAMTTEEAPCGTVLLIPRCR